MVPFSVDMRLHLHQLERQEEEEDAAAEAGARQGQRRGGQHNHFFIAKLGAANASVAWGHGELTFAGDVEYSDKLTSSLCPRY